MAKVKDIMSKNAATKQAQKDVSEKGSNIAGAIFQKLRRKGK